MHELIQHDTPAPPGSQRISQDICPFFASPTAEYTMTVSMKREMVFDWYQSKMSTLGWEYKSKQNSIDDKGVCSLMFDRCVPLFGSFEPEFQSLSVSITPLGDGASCRIEAMIRCSSNHICDFPTRLAYAPFLSIRLIFHSPDFYSPLFLPF
jgi:hypothetical protein